MVGAQSMDIEQAEQAVILTFYGAGGQGPVSLVLAVTLLRQWLSIVYDAYLKAQWPIGMWPAWLKESFPPPRQQAVLLQ